jgi:hypothetical protein
MRGFRIGGNCRPFYKTGCGHLFQMENHFFDINYKSDHANIKNIQGEIR